MLVSHPRQQKFTAFAADTPPGWSSSFQAFGWHSTATVCGSRCSGLSGDRRISLTTSNPACQFSCTSIFLSVKFSPRINAFKIKFCLPEPVPMKSALRCGCSEFCCGSGFMTQTSHMTPIASWRSSWEANKTALQNAKAGIKD